MVGRAPSHPTFSPPNVSRQPSIQPTPTTGECGARCFICAGSRLPPYAEYRVTRRPPKRASQDAPAPEEHSGGGRRETPSRGGLKKRASQARRGPPPIRGEARDQRGKRAEEHCRGGSRREHRRERQRLRSTLETASEASIAGRSRPRGA